MASLWVEAIGLSEIFEPKWRDRVSPSFWHFEGLPVTLARYRHMMKRIPSLIEINRDDQGVNMRPNCAMWMTWVVLVKVPSPPLISFHKSCAKAVRSVITTASARDHDVVGQTCQKQHTQKFPPLLETKILFQRPCGNRCQISSWHPSFIRDRASGKIPRWSSWGKDVPDMLIFKKKNILFHGF